MGRNLGSKTGVVITVPAVCGQCGKTFQVFGKRRPDGPRPARYCGGPCYHASMRGRRPPGFVVSPGGAPKGRTPWNKGRKCLQLSGERNGMYGRTHTPETRALLSRLTSTQLSELTRQRIANSQVPLARSDPEYSRMFRLGWRSARRAALSRDHEACVACGSVRKRMEVHHVVPFSLVLRHELENLITLCGSCHGKVHRGAVELSRAN